MSVGMVHDTRAQTEFAALQAQEIPIVLIFEESLMNRNFRERIAIWWRAFRCHFVPPSIFPATLGAMISWAVDKTFSTAISDHPLILERRRHILA